MGDYINKNLLDASPMRKQKDEAKQLVNKWEKTGLLDRLNEDFKKSGMAVMLENQARQLISEASKTTQVVVLMKNGLVLLYLWFVESLVKLQLKTLFQFNQ